MMSFILVSLAGLLTIPVFLFCIETLAAVTQPKRESFLPPINVVRKRIAVLVPAHNESLGLRETLDNIKAQLHSDDRILVVADNCTDDTPAVARAANAEVVERNDPTKIGKGYALDRGLRHLSADPPEIVVIIDADCRLENHALDRLATACADAGRPAQALYLMNAPVESPVDFHVAEFAFRVKNWIRPLGLRALNLPCQLMGTGMAFPWEVIRSANLASGRIVEDLMLGLDLARAGEPPLFCPSVRVNSEFPLSNKGAKSQRERWEQGHIGMIATIIPRLIFESVVSRNFGLLALTLDAAIPPLALLGMMVSLMFGVSAFGVLVGISNFALAISAASLSAYLVAVILCWVKFGRDVLPLNSILSVASYVIGKFPLYFQILSRGNSPRWIRTDRGKNGEEC